VMRAQQTTTVRGCKRTKPNAQTARCQWLAVLSELIAHVMLDTPDQMEGSGGEWTTCPAGKSKAVPGSDPCKGPAAAADGVYIVKMAVKLPMTKKQFNTGEQANFKQSIASAARVSAADITLDKIENLRRFGRRLLAGSIRVDTSIVAADQTSAKSMANTLTFDKINSELRNNGLPQAEILDSPQVKQIVQDDLKDSNRTPIIIALWCLQL